VKKQASRQPAKPQPLRAPQLRRKSPAAEPQPFKGVGPATQARLAALGISRAGDMLFHLPLRYEDRTRIQPIGSLRPQTRAVIEGVVEHAQVVLRRRRMLLVALSDGSGLITLRFFHFNAAQTLTLQKGARLRCFGEARPGAQGLEMVHPEYQRLKDGAPVPVEEALTPVYPAGEGLSQHLLRRLARQALAELDISPHSLPDLLPAGVLADASLPPLAQALHYVHAPPPDAPQALLLEGRHPAQQRLAFEELLAHTLSLKRLRQNVQREAALALQPTGTLLRRFLDSLPFALTGAQRRAFMEAAADLARPVPMLRLVQGDVGCGKTVVAALALLSAYECGAQAALMAPTELLAEQHYRTLERWLAPLGVPVLWLSGTRKGRARQQALEALARGQPAVVAGTHALFQPEVRYGRLALVVVDEQHRFGVHQRLALRDKGMAADAAAGKRLPHQLIMTATPIPRTLAMTAYADLDVSVIGELPPGRTPVTTVALPESRRAEVVQRIAAACREGRQAYWVCPLIEESEEIEAQAAAATAEALRAALPELSVALAHGRLKPAERDASMRTFKAGAVHLLVATTVIEVGVDVPNASVMVIENAERLGLAQLHQLRGRVGRGAAASSCVLLYRTPLSELARERLAVLRDSNDGFRIAERDLELRGPGELLGTRQTGLPGLRIADLARDRELLPAVQLAATRMLEQHDGDIEPLLRRWLPQGEQYAGV
jgi:ATP-dependent DNA helicase RecG